MQRFYPIPFDIRHSTSANDKSKEIAYKAMLFNYAAHISYHLKKLPQGGYELVPNHKVKDDRRPYVEPPTSRPLTDGKYQYVIGLDGVLKIYPDASHHFLAERAPQVIAAGDIYVENNDIVKVDGEAGGYHYFLTIPKNEDDMDKYLNEEEQIKYKASIEAIIKQVGLPFERYQFSDGPEIPLEILKGPTEFILKKPTHTLPVLQPPLDNPPAEKKFARCRLFAHFAIPAAFAVGGAAYLYSVFSNTTQS